MSSVLQFAGVVFAVATPILIGVFLKHYFEHRSRVGAQLQEMELEMAALDHAALQERVDALQSRVEVLEAVVTDPKYDLRKEIVNL